ncbi:hypothetical protein Hypma_011937 [Hypsizygus marmoreus]|uniref:Uncharacterized protein n=1 Tax=Hypsizygus marmoreus TaxID=39966 RepID=A0A369JH78_HYPMA|nr:hypothetical protein Hypma_011937 [Hypsizygus marmoreus]
MKAADERLVLELTSEGSKRAAIESGAKLAADVIATAEARTECIEQYFDYSYDNQHKSVATESKEGARLVEYAPHAGGKLIDHVLPPIRAWIRFDTIVLILRRELQVDISIDVQLTVSFPVGSISSSTPFAHISTRSLLR